MDGQRTERGGCGLSVLAVIVMACAVAFAGVWVFYDAAGLLPRLGPDLVADPVGTLWRSFETSPAPRAKGSSVSATPEFVSQAAANAASVARIAGGEVVAMELAAAQDAGSLRERRGTAYFRDGSSVPVIVAFAQDETGNALCSIDLDGSSETSAGATTHDPAITSAAGAARSAQASDAAAIDDFLGAPRARYAVGDVRVGHNAALVEISSAREAWTLAMVRVPGLASDAWFVAGFSAND